MIFLGIGWFIFSLVTHIHSIRLKKYLFSMVLSPRERAQQVGRRTPTSDPNKPTPPANSGTKNNGPQPDQRSSIDSFRVNMDGDGDAWVDNPSKNFKSLLGAPALSNFYKVSINLSQTERKGDTNLSDWVTNAGIWAHPAGPTRFDFLCCETLIPGTALDAFSELGSYQGIEEFFPGRRIYTDISLSFYVSSDYLILKLFQEWINYINPMAGNKKGMMKKSSRAGYASLEKDKSYYHRYRYPNQYKTIISINKFEKNLEVVGGGYNKPTSITYKFIDAFPVNISSIPLSYESAQILKVTVDFKYSRYLITSHSDNGTQSPDQFAPPKTDANATSQITGSQAPAAPTGFTINNINFSNLGTDYWNNPSTIDFAKAATMPLF